MERAPSNNIRHRHADTTPHLHKAHWSAIVICNVSLVLTVARDLVVVTSYKHNTSYCEILIIECSLIYIVVMIVRASVA